MFVYINVLCVTGVSHGEELQYMFGFPFINETYMNLTGIYPRQEYDYPDRNISEYMISMLTNFTARGYMLKLCLSVCVPVLQNDVNIIIVAVN